MTYGAGGSTREGTLETRARDPCAPGHEAAPHLSCIGSSRDEHPRDPARALQERRHPPHRRAARRPALGHRRERRVPLRERARRVHPRGDRRLSSTSRSPATPSTIRRRASAQDEICKRSSARSKPAPTRRSRSISSTRTRTSISSTNARRWASRCRSSPASCRSATSRSSRASPTRAARRSRAGCAEARRLRRRHRFDPRFRARRRHATSATTCSRSGAPGLHFYTLNQAGLTSTIWQRLGTVSGVGTDDPRRSARLSSSLGTMAIDEVTLMRHGGERCSRVPIEIAAADPEEQQQDADARGQGAAAAGGGAAARGVSRATSIAGVLLDLNPALAQDILQEFPRGPRGRACCSRSRRSSPCSGSATRSIPGHDRPADGAGRSRYSARSRPSARPSSSCAISSRPRSSPTAT